MARPLPTTLAAAEAEYARCMRVARQLEQEALTNASIARANSMWGRARRVAVIVDALRYRARVDANAARTAAE